MDHSVPLSHPLTPFAFLHDIVDAPSSLAFCFGNPPVTSIFPSQRVSNAESVSMKWWIWLTLKKTSKPELITLYEGNPPVGPAMWKSSWHDIIMHTDTHAYKRTHTHTQTRTHLVMGEYIHVALQLFGRMKHHIDFTFLFATFRSV